MTSYSDWNNQTRETLLQRIKNRHDEDSWEDFIKHYAGYIYNIVRRMNLNHHDAEEIVQTVNLKIWNKIQDFDYDSNKGRFRGWLCTVASNEAKMFLRKKKRRIPELKRSEADEDYTPEQIDMPDINKLITEEWEIYITELAWNNIQDCFEEKTKLAFEMVSKGIDPKKIAEELGIAQSTVYVSKKRVADRLRKEIQRLNYELD